MSQFTKKSLILIVLLICVTISYYYTIYKPEEKIPAEAQKLTPDPVKKLNQILIDLDIQKNFWKNKIKLADQDQYNLFINLSDSLISLEMNGITAHHAQILNYNLSDSIRSQRQSQDIIKLLSEPLEILDQWASIPKEPIRVKDITGYKWNPDSLSFVPDQIDTEFVFIVFKCSKNISIMISQRSIIGDMPSYITSDPLTRFEFITKNQDKMEELPFAHLLQTNWIGIEIPRSDAITLFRALMEKSMLILSL